MDIRDKREEIAKTQQFILQYGRPRRDQLYRLIDIVVDDIGALESEAGMLDRVGRCLALTQGDRNAETLQEELARIAEIALRLRGKLRPP